MNPSNIKSTPGEVTNMSFGDNRRTRTLPGTPEKRLMETKLPSAAAGPANAGNVPKAGHPGAYKPSQEARDRALAQHGVATASSPAAAPAKPLASAPQFEEGQIPASLLPYEGPGFTAPNDSPTAIAVGLPSKFAFYPFQDIYISPLKAKHIAKLNKAWTTQSLLPMVEAVSSCLSSTSGIPNLGFMLTVPDFYFLLYYQRLNCFTKFLFRHKVTCTNAKHLEEVKEGKKAPETLVTETLVHNSTLVVKDLEYIPDPDVYQVAFNGTMLGLRPATMLDVVTMAENPNFFDEEYRLLAKLACYLPADIPFNTRVEIVGELEPDDLAMITEYEGLCDTYGVQEHIKSTCSGCGASKMAKVKIDAHSFLPERE